MNAQRLINGKGASALLASPMTKTPGLLQRKCACGQHTMAGAECFECNKKRTVQRSTANSGVQTQNSFEAPPIVHEVLRSPGQPLDRDTLDFMDSRLNYNFSRIPGHAALQRSAPSTLSIGNAGDHFEQEAGHVAARVMQSPESGRSEHSRCDSSNEKRASQFAHVRVHTDQKAADSARAVGALAYTVGHNVVFAEGQYAPGTSSGKRLLAHELTHTLQQSSGASAMVIQRMLPCPGSLAGSDPVPAGWKPYHGNSCVFHCCYRGILEDRIPTQTDPQNECFYDETGTLVTASHEHGGCRGTPNSFDSASDWWGHTVKDPGGILQSGWGAFWSSRGREAQQHFESEGRRIIECNRACNTQPWYLRGLCLQGCSGQTMIR